MLTRPFTRYKTVLCVCVCVYLCVLVLHTIKVKRQRQQDMLYHLFQDMSLILLTAEVSHYTVYLQYVCVFQGTVLQM